MSLTPEEIDVYLTEFLHYKNWKEDFQNSRENGLHFITKVYQLWLTNVPFHNLGILLDSEDVEFSSEQEIVDTVLSGGSVMCAGNVFLKCLYSALGFNSFLIPSILNNASLPSPPVDEKVNDEEIEDTTTIIHLTVGVECPQTHSIYFIDIGSGLPLTEPIPLDALPYQRTAGGFRYEVRQDPCSGRIRLVELGGNIITGKFGGCHKEMVRYSLDGIPKSFEDVFHNVQIAVEHTKKCSRFLSLSVFSYIKKNRAREEQDFKFITICGNWVAIIEGESKRNLFSIKDKNELCSFIRSTFPTLNMDDVSAVFSLTN